MPQEFRVLQCFSCKMYQVDMVKKVPKWACKLCGEKQSLQKIFGKGTGKECRILVQSLNQQGIMKREADFSKVGSEHVDYQLSAQQNVCIPSTSENKWLEFIDNESSEEEEILTQYSLSSNISCKTLVRKEVNPLQNESSKWTEFLDSYSHQNKQEKAKITTDYSTHLSFEHIKSESLLLDEGHKSNHEKQFKKNDSVGPRTNEDYVYNSSKRIKVELLGKEKTSNDKKSKWSELVDEEEPCDTKLNEFETIEKPSFNAISSKGYFENMESDLDTTFDL